MISYTTAWLHRSPKGDNFSTYKNEVSGSIKRYSVKEYEGNNPKQGGGNSNIFYFHLPGDMIQFDDHIFQLG